MTRVAIVGAGPAGIAAADVLVAHGVVPVVIDEGLRPGGQIYRQPRPGLRLDIMALLGAEAGNYRRTHATFESLKDRIDYRPQTLAWAIEDRTLHTMKDSAAATVGFDAIILATGAADRTLPIKGWTLPGVFTLGGAQVLLKEHGCLIGRRIVFCGRSPLRRNTLALLRGSVLQKSFRAQGPMEPVHQCDHVEHRHAELTLEVVRIGRDVGAFANDRAD